MEFSPRIPNTDIRERTELERWFGYGLGDDNFDEEMRSHIDKVYGEAFIETFKHRDIGSTNGFVHAIETDDEQLGKNEEE